MDTNKLTTYANRFPLVALLDEHNQPTGQRGQVFGEVVDADGQSTGLLAVMLTAGGQGCKHVPRAKLRPINPATGGHHA